VNLTDPIYTNEAKARAHLEALRWPDGPVCPHCGVIGNAVRLAGESTRPGLFKCRDCRQPFSVTVGTVFERSKIPLHKWLLAANLMASSKKGFSAHQLHRAIKVTYKTAWFMMHRLREAMRDTDTGLLGGPGSSGIVEADEVYLGKAKGKGKGAHYNSKQKIVALVERKGRVRAFHVPTVNVHTVKEILHGQVAKSARLMTDSAGLYKNVGKSFASHETVNHLRKEYARGDVTTNTVEGYFGVLQRGLRGIYQHVSPEHLHRYVNEFSFRYNNRSSRGVEDAERAARLLVSIGGKRLTYRRSDATA
jgi:transposase-like protein